MHCPALGYPGADASTQAWSKHPSQQEFLLTCIVTSLSSTMTSFVRKSAPIVALYWLLNFLFTYWFMSDVFPTLYRKTKRLGRLLLQHRLH